MLLQLSANVQFKTTDPTLDYGKLTRQLGKVLLLLLLLLAAAAQQLLQGGAGTIFQGTKKKETFAIKVLPISRCARAAAVQVT